MNVMFNEENFTFGKYNKTSTETQWGQAGRSRGQLWHACKLTRLYTIYLSFIVIHRLTFHIHLYSY